MKEERDSSRNGTVCSGYAAPQATRLSDAATASGNQCAANGNTAGNTCVATGSGAIACLNYGNGANNACVSNGNQAHECGSGNSAG